MMKKRFKIFLETVSHNSEKRIKLLFPYNALLIDEIKLYTNCKWSNTMTAWHMPYSKRELEKLKEILAQKFEIVYINRKTKKELFKPERNIPENITNSVSKYKDYLKVQRYSEQTIRTYISIISKFFIFIKYKDPAEINIDDIDNYNRNYIIENSMSQSYQNQFVSTVKLFYEVIFNTKLNIEEIQRPRRVKALPKVLAKEDVIKLFDSVRNLKHKTILVLIYSAGLRRSELLHLKVSDIDSKRMVINIRHGKGNKDRIVRLSENVLELTREYFKLYHPKEFLIEGKGGNMYSASSIWKIFKHAKEAAGIKMKGGVHILRHSYATHIHEDGCDIRYIQEILGHKSSKTTEIYTHVSTKSIQKIKNPIEDIDLLGKNKK